MRRATAAAGTAAPVAAGSPGRLSRQAVQPSGAGLPPPGRASPLQPDGDTCDRPTSLASRRGHRLAKKGCIDAVLSICGVKTEQNKLHALCAISLHHIF